MMDHHDFDSNTKAYRQTKSTAMEDLTDVNGNASMGAEWGVENARC